MSVHVVDRNWIVSDRTPHQARRVSDDTWVVSFLRGRMVSTEQATAAIQAAELVSLTEELVGRFGLTALEAVGLVVLESPWDTRPMRDRYRLPRPGGRHRR
ncbi:hypothetical protein [Nocardia asiatica]|uniref:hypothetical protein n=1 Tax=Nocardia asiatica TaxID=209252 RepID=UPI0002E323BA|nr:hypothetical protein [Nocardia asiatica]